MTWHIIKPSINRTLVDHELEFSQEVCNMAIGALGGIGAVGVFFFEFGIIVAIIILGIYSIKKYFNFREKKLKETGR